LRFAFKNCIFDIDKQLIICNRINVNELKQ